MPRYRFQTNGHDIQLSVSLDGVELTRDGSEVPHSEIEFDPECYAHKGGFQVIEDGETCTYEWSREGIGGGWLQSGNTRHTVLRNGVIVFQCEVSEDD